MNRQISRLWFVLACLVFPQLGVANPVQAEHIEVQLIAENTSIQPGKPFWVALRLEPEEHWHIYWRNPGDSGLPPRIDWQLPEGSSAGEINWPYPKRFLFDDLISYGYKGETLLLTQIQPPADWRGTAPFTIAASAFWLVCEATCIPGNADLSLELPVTESTPEPDSRWQAAFAATRERLPMVKSDWQSAFTMHDEKLYLQLQTDTPVFLDAKQVSFFPYENELIAYDAPQELRWQPGKLYFRQRQNQTFEQAPETLNGVIVVKTPGGESAYKLSALPNLVAQPEIFEGDALQQPVAKTTSIFLVILSAIIGGVLLNLMPCVFPVLSLKAIGLLECVNISQHEQRMHGVAYTLGAMVFFAAVAGVLLLLRASGASIGWGFQLQSPWFVALLAYLLFVLGLSFSGFLEIGAGFMGVGDSLTSRSGYSGSFFTGALAAIVASPCTAPFMGTAIAFAISQPAVIALLVFTALGFGMALPFLLISCMPKLVQMLPKPGPWMNVLRQFMAFPLYITVIWLLWVLGRQTDASGMATALIGILLLAFAIWVWKLRAHSTGRWRRFAAMLTVGATCSAFLLLHLPFISSVPALNVEAATRDKAVWEPYSADRLAELRSEQKPVFVNMTADWCISCIANERVALSFPSVQDAFVEKEIALLKGDWTSRDPKITKVLHQFGREGVPLYILYPPQPGSEPMVLPQFLTPKLVLDALDRLADSGDGKKKGDGRRIMIIDMSMPQQPM